MTNSMFSPLSDRLQICSLGSGSKGNATLVAYRQTLLLIDCGFSAKEAVRRLALKGISPQQITAILVTHEHADHIGGVASLSNKYSIPVWINKGTSLHKKGISIKQKALFNSHREFSLGDLTITPVTVPHDARESTQFIFSMDNQSIGLLTDVGHITPHILRVYAQCDLLLLEFNYDHEMLMSGKYPYSLKKRVSSDLGHLSNQQALELLSKMETSNLRTVVAMHRSEENNSRDLVEKALNAASTQHSLEYYLADQVAGFDWLMVPSAEVCLSESLIED